MVIYLNIEITLDFQLTKNHGIIAIGALLPLENIIYGNRNELNLRLIICSTHSIKILTSQKVR